MRPAWLSVFAAVLVAIGCGRGNFSERTSAGKENVLRYAIDTNPTTLDPAIVQDLDTGDLLLNVYEGLVGWDARNEIAPALAESWTVRDGTEYTFVLKDATFHNGRKVEAADVKFSLERACDPATRSPTAANYLAEIVGVADVVAGKTKEIRGVEVVDERTVRITIDRPRAYFLGKLTYPCAYVVCREALTPGKEISTVAEAVGTGPFRVAQIVPDQLVRLEAFAGYHGGAPSIEGIERPVVKDAAARLNKFRAGELDLLSLERQDVAGVQGDPALAKQLRFEPRPGVFYVAMNPLAEPAFKDRRVRRAIAMAIDKDWLTQTILSGLNPRADGFVPPGVMGHREQTAALPFDSAEANRLLDAAGYRDRSKFPTLYLALREQTPDGRTVSEAVAGQLQKHLGIRVELRSMEWRAFLEKRNRKELAFYHNSWYADYLDPENFLSFLFATDVPMNGFGYSNPEVDALCRIADASGDPSERLRLYAKIEDEILQDAPWVPLYYARDALLVSPRVEVTTNLFGFLPQAKTRLASH